MGELFKRSASGRVSELLSSFRVVMLGGARQTGKTTLARQLLKLPVEAWLTFDAEAVLRRALDDPEGFVETLPRPAVVDEFQRAGRGFLLALKQRVDQDNSRGQFLLTGSTNYLADKSFSETLAGRTGRIQLWPLSVGEKRGVSETFIDRLFEPRAWPLRGEPLGRSELVNNLLEGGFPEIVTVGLRGRPRRDWFDSYVHDVVSREALRPVAEVRREPELRKTLRLLAARSGQELITSGVADDAEIKRDTAASYIALLEALHLVVRLPAWSTNATTRAKRRPKLVLADSGLAADLTGIGEKDFAPAADGVRAGALFETFVVMELWKQSTWSERSVDLFHLRDRAGMEVDLLVEDRRTGEVVAIEIKLTSSPTAKHARHLETLRERIGQKFVTGLVVHAGTHTLPLGERVWAVPVSALWARGES